MNIYIHVYTICMQSFLYNRKDCNLLSSVTYVLQIGEDPSVVARQPPPRNSPRFAEFVAEDGGSTYVLFVEQTTICGSPAFTKTLFLWFCVHYVFHLSYSAPLTEVCEFFQEFVFGLPLTGKRSASYLSTATDIQQLTIH